MRVCLIFVWLTGGCAAFRHADHSEPPIRSTDATVSHSMYFFGNGDAGPSLPDETLTGMSRALSAAPGQKTLLMLGSNAVKLSMRDTSDDSRPSTELGQLEQRFALLRNFNGAVYAVPGASEWLNGGRDGALAVQLLEYYLERKLGFGDIVKPDHGCPGPEEVYLDHGTVLLLIDTQWWLHDWDKPAVDDGCDVDNTADFLVALDDAIKRNYDKKIIVAGHHAIRSSGRRGGHFPLKTHLFPLTEAQNNLYLPLPGVGTLYVLYRMLLGNDQDQSNPRYKMMSKALQQVFSQHDNLVYLSGNERSLEYHASNNIHQVNAGSIAAEGEIRGKKGGFAVSTQGYGALQIHKDGAVWLEFYALRDGSPVSIYRQKLFSAMPAVRQQWIDATTRTDYHDSVATARATAALKKKGTRPGMMGNNYRAEWTAPIEGVPYFDLEREKGGLTIVKRGGGMQTKSLRLEDSVGREYVLRSVQKYPLKALPDDLRGTIAEDVIREQISASHPYGALAIPRLADAAGVYHTNPKLVWLPDDPELGIYREIYGNALYIFEERPDEEHKGVQSFGASEKIISTPSVVENLIEHGKRYVDQGHTVRSRLFDILIGDWDRHDDQWRWAMFEDSTERKYYRPIPRDRDQAFFWSDGWLLKVATRRWGMPKFQGFHHEIRDVAGMNYNARFFDRTFINLATLEDWLREARDLQQRITDADIAAAVRDLPPEIYALHGEEIISKLKARKRDLPKYAREMYLFLAKEVDLLGTEDRDLFEVHRMPSGNTTVRACRIGKNKGNIKYQRFERTFVKGETREIRLYGFDGDDVFELTGNAPTGIRVRIIGGGGDDVVDDQSRVSGLKKHTVVYDRSTGITMSGSGEIRDRTSDRRPGINTYNRKSFRYNVAMPLVTARYNPDDKFFIGAGVMATRHGFRKDPFRSRHMVMADLAPVSGSYNFSYKGQFTDVLARWDLIINARMSVPSFSDYFYGYGNNTRFDRDRFERDAGFYRVRYEHYVLHPEMEYISKNDHHRFLVGGGYQSVNIRSKLNESGIEQRRFIVQYADTLDYPLLDRFRHYLGLYSHYTFDNTDDELQPTSGFRYRLGILNIADVDQVDRAVAFTRLSSSLSFFYTFGRSLKTTLALRAGGMTNLGDYEFYHAARLGGGTNFRGVRRMRFAGAQAVFQNTELRVKLFEFTSPLIPGDVGLTFFHDVGRVWHPEGEPSNAGKNANVWHRGYGAGVWIAPLSKAALGLDYAISTLDERAFFLRLGFFF